MTDPTGPEAPDATLDGHTLDELVDYLRRGRQPLDPSIEGSPACRIALSGLERLDAFTGTLLDEDAAAASPQEPWIDEVLSRIPLESRAGREFPFTGLPEGVDAIVTEGALRGLIRAVGDSVPGALTGRVRISPDPTGTSVDLEVEITLFYGTPVAAVDGELRRRLALLLPEQSPFVLRRLDLRVRDVLVLSGPR